MTILSVYHPDDTPEHFITLDRSYEDNTVAISVEEYGRETNITIPTPELIALLRSIGISAA